MNIFVFLRFIRHRRPPSVHGRTSTRCAAPASSPTRSGPDPSSPALSSPTEHMEAAAATALPVTGRRPSQGVEPGLRSQSQRRRPSPLPGGSCPMLPGPVVSLCLVRTDIHGSLCLIRDGPTVQETMAAAAAQVAVGGLTVWSCGSSRCCRGVL